MKLNRLNRVILINFTNEKSSVLLYQLIRSIVYILEGKFFAYCVGWKKSYLGKGSRVIGTKFISLIESASIGRYAWIEVITEKPNRAVGLVISIGLRFSASERLHISAIAKIEIGDDCLFGSGVYIADHNHGSYQGTNQSHPEEPPVSRRLSSIGTVCIGSNVWIGDNVTIVGNVQIGCGSVIGANSVVTRSIPDNVIAAGSPAKIIKKFNFENNKWELCK